jgi:hypothetical protein
VFGARLYSDLGAALNLQATVEQVKHDVMQLNERAVRSGIESISVPAGSSRGDAEISLREDVDVGASTYVSVELAEPRTSNATLTATLQRVQNTPILGLSVHLDQEVRADTAVGVEWIVSP